jgi:hypothetical protein
MHKLDGAVKEIGKKMAAQIVGKSAFDDKSLAGTLVVSLGVLAVDYYTRPLFTPRVAWAIVKYGMAPIGFLAFLQLWMSLVVESMLVDGSNMYDDAVADSAPDLSAGQEPRLRLLRRGGDVTSDDMLAFFTFVVTTEMCLILAAGFIIRVERIPIVLCATILGLWGVLQRYLYSYLDGYKKQEFTQLILLLSGGTVFITCIIIYCTFQASKLDDHYESHRAHTLRAPIDKPTTKDYRPTKHQSRIQVKSSRYAHHPRASVTQQTGVTNKS